VTWLVGSFSRQAAHFDHARTVGSSLAIRRPQKFPVLFWITRELETTGRIIMQQSTGHLIERLSRLEAQQARLQRSNKHLRWLTGGLMLLCCAIFTMGQTSSAVPETLEAQQFLLRDSSGKLRGAIGVMSDGAVGFNLEDPTGHTRLTVDLAASGDPGVDLYDQTGRIRATMALGPEGQPGFGLYGPNGHLRTSLDVPAAKTPGLAFYHEDGQPAWGAP
jgi:hypothetical protein